MRKLYRSGQFQSVLPALTLVSADKQEGHFAAAEKIKQVHKIPSFDQHQNPVEL